MRRVGEECARYFSLTIAIVVTYVAGGYLLKGTIFEPLFKPIQPMIGLSPITSEHIAAILYGIGWVAMVTCVVWWIMTIRHRVETHIRYVGDAFTVFAFLYVIDLVNYVYAPPFEDWFITRFWVFPALLTFYFVISMDCRNRVWVLALIIAFVIIQSLHAITYYIGGYRRYVMPTFGARAIGGYNTPNTLYPICLLSIPWCLILAKYQRSTWAKVLWALGGLLIFGSLILTFSRTAWLGVAVCLIFLTVCLRCLRMSLNSILLSFVAVMLIVGCLFVRTKGRLIGCKEDTSFWMRPTIWKAAIHIWRRHWLRGVGFMNYAKYQARMLPSFPNVEAKSLLLQVAAEFGVVGVGAFLYLTSTLVWMLGRSILSLKPTSWQWHVAIAVAAGLGALFIAALFDTPILSRGRAPSTFLWSFTLASADLIAGDGGDIYK